MVPSLIKQHTLQSLAEYITGKLGLPCTICTYVFVSPRETISQYHNANDALHVGISNKDTNSETCGVCTYIPRFHCRV